jgi:uncharacterized protein
MRRLALGLVLAVAFALPARGLAAETPLPPAPTRWLTDTAGFLSPGAAQQIDARLEAYQRATGHQVVVWIGDSIGTADLADWAVRTFAAWKPGRKGLDDGVAVFVLATDRKIDIEVGYGLEGQVTDAKSHQVIDGMAELLRAGERDRAVASGVESVLTAIEGQPFPGGQVQGFSSSQRGPPPVSLAQKIIYGILGLAFLVFFITNPRMAMLMLWSIMGRGGGGGFGGGDGGGFSGGGGRSGGGGARGGW